MKESLVNSLNWLSENCPRGDTHAHVCASESAEILATLGIDQQGIVVGMMHAYQPFSESEIAEITHRFGKDVMTLLTGVNRMDKLSGLLSASENRSQSEANEENLRKMLITMVDDVRVVLIKLATELQLLRHLKSAPPSTKKAVGRMTLDVYAPLANRLGVWQLKWEMEDHAMRCLEPVAYTELAAALDEKRVAREHYIKKYITCLDRALSQVGIKAKVYGRPKHIYSIWKKMKTKGVSFENLWDIRAVRILVESVSDCYSALGIVHTNWRHLPGEFDDYIATPKENGYRSIHTVIIGPHEKSVEVQIRTYAMHEENELGVAAHWRYKEKAAYNATIDSKVLWLRQLLEWKEELMDETELADQFKGQIEDERVYVFTPKGTVIDLPGKSTPIDFAYAIHTEVGHRTRGAKINGKMVTLDYQLKTGDQVHIQTSKTGGPSRDWIRADLQYTRTHRAKSRIQQWFRHRDYDQHVSEGRSQLEKELHRLGLDDLSYDKVCQSTHFNKVDDMLAAIGTGDYKLSKALSPFRVTGETLPKIKTAAFRPDANTDDFKVAGVGNLLTHMSRCCHPVPGDRIIGYITAGRGVTIHRQNCANILNLNDSQASRLIHVEWGEKSGSSYPVDVQLSAYHRSGLLHDVTEILKTNKIDLLMVNMETDDEHVATIQIRLDITGIQKLSRVLRQLSTIPNVLDVKRVTH